MKKFIYTMIAVAMLTACKTTKSVQKDSTDAVTSATNVTAQSSSKPSVTPEKPSASAATATPMEQKSLSAKVDITANVMGQSITVDGKLQMRTNEVIRITIVPYGLMEVGRLELTPDYILLVNRLDKEYCKASYSEISTVAKAPLDFNMMQKRIWEEKFTPGRVFDFSLDKSKTGRGDINLSFKVGKVTEGENFEGKTNVNEKYRQVSMQELLGKLMSM